MSTCGSSCVCVCLSLQASSPPASGIIVSIRFLCVIISGGDEQHSCRAVQHCMRQREHLLSALSHSIHRVFRKSCFCSHCSFILKCFPHLHSIPYKISKTRKIAFRPFAVTLEVQLWIISEKVLHSDRSKFVA